MKIIVPMAGMGKRMRPHTMLVPKPLIPVGGKPIVQRLVEDIASVCEEQIEEIAFIIGPSFGKAVEENLVKVAESLGAKGSICYQTEALGTAHAILCAQQALDGPVIIAFADTLFRADFKLDGNQDGIIWVQQIDDPSAFGVVKLNDKNEITDFVEKPKDFVSDLAIIGIYYINDGPQLKKELQYLIDNDIKDGGEYQLTNALENLKAKGTTFVPGQVKEWLDCGNYAATVYTNQRVLEFIKDDNIVASDLKLNNSVVIEPCMIGEGVVIENSVVGPHVTLSAGCTVTNSILKNSIVYENTSIENEVISDSMIGNDVKLKGQMKEVSIGSFSSEK
ncbi:MAG: glucose-1-phosphate thymidylyltransferase [Glaciecola sp.]|jgi:glucose-1-phosphate thymidylyltransferase